MDEEIGGKPPADLNNWLGLINPNCTLRGMSCYEMEIDYGSRRGIWPQIHKHQSCVPAWLQIHMLGGIYGYYQLSHSVAVAAFVKAAL